MVAILIIFTVVISIMWIFTFYKVYHLCDHIINFKLCFYYHTKFGLTKSQKDFISKYDGYFAFQIDYTSTMSDLKDMSIDEPKTFHDAVETFIELKEYY